jgi:hypothetical protein
LIQTVEEDLVALAQRTLWGDWTFWEQDEMRR